MGKEEEWLTQLSLQKHIGTERHRGARRALGSGDRDRSHYITFTPPTSAEQRRRGDKRDSEPLWTGIIKWFFLCSVYGPMVIH